MPALKGSGAVATISSNKGHIRRIISTRGLDPLPEMTRTGLSCPGDDNANDGSDDSDSTAQENEQTPGRDGRRSIRKPDYFAV